LFIHLFQKTCRWIKGNLKDLNPITDITDITDKNKYICLDYFLKEDIFKKKYLRKVT